MPLSTSLASVRPPERHDPWRLEALEAFYRLHAHVYDVTRPFLLFGRDEAVKNLDLRPGERVLDVGCGTGWSMPRLQESGAYVVGIESSEAMRRQARKRLRWHLLDETVILDPRPYGTHTTYERAVDGVLFSYSLSMMPPFDTVIARARADLRSGGRVAAVDFLDARWPVGPALRASHVFLGPERLDTLRHHFPRHRLEIRSAGPWRYFLFIGHAE